MRVLVGFMASLHHIIQHHLMQSHMSYHVCHIQTHEPDRANPLALVIKHMAYMLCHAVSQPGTLKAGLQWT